MMNIYLFVLIFLLIVYFYFSMFHKNTENFDNSSYDRNDIYNPKYYGIHGNYDDIYDEFYSFYYDSLFFDEKCYQSMIKIIFGYLSNVYNNHLILGMKHGGHICNMVDNQISLECTSRSQSVIQKSRFNYPEHKNRYKHIEDYESKYIYEQDTFTQVSMLDNEIYYCNNLEAILINVYSWLIHKGLLFIQVYNDEKSFMQNIVNKSKGNYEVSKIVHSREITKIENNHYTLIEKMKLKNNKNERKNIHHLNFYHNEYIKEVCNNIGLIIVDEIPIMGNMKFLIFRKSQ